MSNKKEEDSSNFSSTKTNSSTINKDNTSKNEEDDIFYKARIRGGIKHKSNNYQPGRATISVPLTSFSGISHNASFQSKLLFFNGGKPRPKFQHIPYPNEKVPEDNKKKTINKNDIKKNEKKVEKTKLPIYRFILFMSFIPLVILNRKNPLLKKDYQQRIKFIKKKRQLMR